MARSLWAAGVPVLVITTAGRPATWSRSCRSIVIDRLDGEPLLSALLRAQRQIGGRPALFLADEMAVFTISEFRDELTQAYRFRLPPEPMVAALSDKAAFQKLAEESGYPVPRSVVLQTPADLDRLPRLEPPIIVKPIDKRLVHSGRVGRIFKTDTLDEARMLCSDLVSNANTMIAQEWIEGPDSDVYFCLFYRGRDGEVVSMFTGRKILADPAGMGSTLICRAAPDVRQALEPLTASFAACVDFAGMGSLEFKRDRKRDRFVIIEPTVGRADWQEEIATLCGVNIPLAAYNHELGLPPLPSMAVRDDIAWRSSFLKRWPSTEPRRGAHVYDGFWRPNDPMPAILHYAFDTPFRYAIGPLLQGRRAGSTN